MTNERLSAEALAAMRERDTAKYGDPQWPGLDAAPRDRRLLLRQVDTLERDLEQRGRQRQMWAEIAQELDTKLTASGARVAALELVAEAARAHFDRTWNGYADAFCVECQHWDNEDTRCPLGVALAALAATPAMEAGG
jgi:hypothetical protein